MKRVEIHVVGTDFYVVLGKNLINSNCSVIAHQTNCLGIMGSGVAVAIKNTYPEVFTLYHDLCKQTNPLGTTQLVEVGPEGGKQRFIANVFGQYSIGREKQQTDYDALKRALTDLRTQMEEKNLNSVAFPVYMGAARGGGNWAFILAMIMEIFKCSGISIELDAYWGKDAQEHYEETVQILQRAHDLSVDP